MNDPKSCPTTAPRASYLLLLLSLVLFLCSPFLISLQTSLARVTIQEAFPQGDDSLTEMKTISASLNRELLGPYSRLRWNHPGPLYFYSLVPVYLLMGSNYPALSLAVATNHCILLALLGWLTWVVYKEYGWDIPVCLLVILGVYSRHIPLDVPWNACVLAIPFVTLCMVCAWLCVGCLWALTPAILLGSFLVQTHVGTSICVLAVIGCAVGVFLSPNVAAKIGLNVHRKNAKAWWLIAAAALVISWAPPVYEQLTNDPGNMTKLARFFTQAEGHQTMTRTVAALSEMLWSGIFAAQVPDDGNAGDRFDMLFVGFLAVNLISLPFAYRYNMKHGQKYGACLCLIGAVALVSATYTILNVKGQLHCYIITWMSSISVPVLIGISGSVVKELSDRFFCRGHLLKVIAALSLAVILTVISLNPFRDLYRASAGLPAPNGVEHVTNAVLKEIGYDNAKRPLIIIGDHSKWTLVSGIALQLFKKGVPFSVTSDWLFMFGNQFAPSGVEDVGIIFSGKTLDSSSLRLIGKYSGDARISGDDGDTFIYRFDLPRPERVRCPQP